MNDYQNLLQYLDTLDGLTKRTEEKHGKKL